MKTLYIIWSSTAKTNQPWEEYLSMEASIVHEERNETNSNPTYAPGCESSLVPHQVKGYLTKALSKAHSESLMYASDVYNFQQGSNL